MAQLKQFQTVVQPRRPAQADRQLQRRYTGRSMPAAHGQLTAQDHLLDANYWRGPGRGPTMQLDAFAGDCSRRLEHARVDAGGAGTYAQRAISGAALDSGSTRPRCATNGDVRSARLNPLIPAFLGIRREFGPDGRRAQPCSSIRSSVTCRAAP